MLTTSNFIVVDRKNCQSFREILGDAKVFDKKRKISYKDNKVLLPILKVPDVEITEKLKIYEFKYLS